MANKYANLVGINKIKDEYTKINTGFDGVETDINAVNGLIDAVDSRVDTIITTPIEGAAAAQEIVDARVSAVKSKTFATLDARFEESEQDIAKHKAENVHIGKNDAVRVYNNANISIPHGDPHTFMGFNSERFDNADMHDEVTNNGRLTCKVAGIYYINANIRFAANSTGNRVVRILKNRTDILCGGVQKGIEGDNTAEINVSTIAYLNVNDYIEVRVAQYSGGTLDLIYTNNLSPEFMMVKVG